MCNDNGPTCIHVKTFYTSKPNMLKLVELLKTDNRKTFEI